MAEATIFQAGGNMGGDVDVEGNEVIDGAYYVEYGGRCVSPPFYHRKDAQEAAEQLEHAHQIIDGEDREVSDLQVWSWVQERRAEA